MKLQEIVTTIEGIANSQPSVNQVFEGNVYQLNELKDIKYGVSVITQGQHKQQGGFLYFNFIIYYIDRLTSTGDNRLNVQSTAIDTLSNIIKSMNDLDFDFQDITYQTFTQRFEAECAGAYAQVSFLAPTNYCSVDYRED